MKKQDRGNLRGRRYRAAVIITMILIGVSVAPSHAVIILPENYDWESIGDEPELEVQESEPIIRPEPASEDTSKVVLRLRAPDVVPKGSIFLPNVCEIDCADEVLMKELQRIVLGDAPKPGEKTVVYPRRIETSLRALGLRSGDFSIEGPDRIVLESPSQRIPMDVIEKTINLTLQEELDPDGKGNVEAFLIRSPPEFHVPPGDLEVRIEDINRPGRGIRHAQVAFFVDGEKVETQTLAVRVNHEIPALVAARDLERGTLLSDRDLEIALVSNRDSNSEESGPITDPSILLGATLKKSVQSGMPITWADAEQTPLVEEGEVVTLVQQYGSVKITSPGRLLENLFHLGQNVKVRVAKTNETVYGTAISGRIVKLN